MRDILARLTGAPIRWQIASVLFVTLLIAQAVTVGLITVALRLSGTDVSTFAARDVAPLTTAVAIASASGGEREAAAVLRGDVESDPRFSISPEPPSAIVGGRSSFDESFQEALRAAVPDAWKTRVVAYEKPGVMFLLLPARSLAAAAQLPDGNWLVFEQDEETVWSLYPSTLIVRTLIVLAIPLAFLAIWSSTALVAPISRLAAGVDRFSRDLDAPAISVGGAREIQTAAAAFNAMRIRIRKLVEDRSRSLQAIGHDMRTPLTRLKLRVESIEDSQIRDPIMDDVNIIQRMINSVLAFLRSQQYPLSSAKTDLAALVQTVVANLSDQGMDADYRGPSERLVVVCDRDLMRRALENLTNNAIAYAGSVTVRLGAPEAGWVGIDVIDAGPGIPEPDRELMMEPFKKGDRSRPVCEGSGAGFGMGLAIAKAILEAHGGTLTLGSNRPQGRVASIRRPGQPPRDSAAAPAPSLERA